MFQILCCEKIDWDEELHGDSRDMFNSFVTNLQHLSNVSVPRCYFDVSSKPKNIQLHGFSDASQQAFAAVVYLRSIYEDGHVAVKLVASKTKVAPTNSSFRTSGSPYSRTISGNDQGIFRGTTFRGTAAHTVYKTKSAILRY